MKFYVFFDHSSRLWRWTNLQGVGGFEATWREAFGWAFDLAYVRDTVGTTP